MQRDLDKVLKKEIKRSKTESKKNIIKESDVEEISTQDIVRTITQLDHDTHEVVKTENNK